LNRNPKNLAARPYDVLVVGGGIYGSFVAWDAALRGLSVALVDKGDFGHATSANNFRIIHGGLRYLQHGDIRRMRQSIRERMILMRIAPHLIHPLPFLVPTYGHLARGREAMGLALWLNDLIGFDRNRLTDPEKFLPRGSVISKDRCIELFPGVDEKGLTGAAIWYDCQMLSPERLTLSLVKAAAQAGADVCNYVEVRGFLSQQGRVTGARILDVLSGERFEIVASVVVNCGGPWVNALLSQLNGYHFRQVRFSKAMNILVRRQWVPRYAVGLYSKHPFRDKDALFNRGSRLLFITPWQGCSLIGTTHELYNGDPNFFAIPAADVNRFVDEINQAYPSACLRREDVSYVFAGLLPADGGSRADQNVNLQKHFQIFDHARAGGVEGIISVVGVKFTTARDVAEKVVNLVFKKLGKLPPKCKTASTPVFGGRIERVDEFMRSESDRNNRHVTPDVLRHLVLNYGSAYENVLHHIRKDARLGESLAPPKPVIKAEVLHGVREEMGMKLADIVMRRTELGLLGDPGDKALKTCAELMAPELGWDAPRMQKELEETKGRLFESSLRASA
jgi:glycerol-3-phosphate dehydrogenase